MNSIKLAMIRGALQYLTEQQQAVAHDTDGLREFTHQDVIRIINRKLDYIKNIFDADPRESMSQEDLFREFTVTFKPNPSTGNFLLRAGDFDDFCHNVVEKHLENGINVGMRALAK